MNDDHDSPKQIGCLPALSEAASSHEKSRRDGWTPFARRVFLTTLAETGRITFACQCAGLSKQSAYALRNRDQLFAAGWEAACFLARNPIADTLLEQSAEGVTETITRNGEVVAERHRYDPRLSVAVLNRLDKRCDEARTRGARHLRLVRHWDEWVELVGSGDEAAARAVLATGSLPSAQHGQLGQLPAPENSAIAAPADPPGDCWQDDHGIWWTDFPPPDDFDGQQEGRWGEFGYKRECSGDEADLLDAAEEIERSEGLTEATAARDAWFAELREELAALQAETPAAMDGEVAPDASAD